MTIISLFGRPGAGKSTVCRYLAERHGFLHLPLGDMLKDPDTLANIGINPDQMRVAIETGRTVTSEKLYPWLDSHLRTASATVVDGYPRAANSLAPYAALVDSLPAGRNAYALYLDCPTVVTHPRLHARGRPDDDDRIAMRDVEFDTVQLPLLKRLPERARLVTVDASGDQATVIAAVEFALDLPRASGRAR